MRRECSIPFSHTLAAALFAAWCVALPTRALAQASARSVINSGDTAWMLIASALVLLMTPGLAIFYGGMVRRKNVLSTFMYSRKSAKGSTRRNTAKPVIPIHLLSR